MTIRKVPKYFTPTLARDRLTANPIRQSNWPHKTNGKRRLMRSDHIAHTTTVTATTKQRVSILHAVDCEVGAHLLATMYGGMVRSWEMAALNPNLRYT